MPPQHRNAPPLRRGTHDADPDDPRQESLRGTPRARRRGPRRRGLFLTLGILVRYSPLQTFDLRVTQDVQRDDSSALTVLMRCLTDLGSPNTVPVVAILAALGLYRARLPRAAVAMLLSILSVPLFTVLKEFWHRARPDAALVHVAVKTSGTSFPSGHATGGTAVYGALAALAWIHLARRRERLPVVLALGLLPVGIDVSRVYLGAHWLSDVVGGSAVGLLLLVLVLRWYVAGLEDTDETEAAKGA